ncbi:MAG: SRPBCC domain-containing protein [Bacteroidetes bacterium]|nr:SRPBCC domain-containing protein [Bacteroidota bacterium]MCH8245437.1 SRPBCC domain-containing protein [Bacteroidota bacterium]
METRSHIHEEQFTASPETVFKLLHTPSAIRAWWGAAQAIIMAVPGGSWSATWGEDEDDPDYVTTATIRDFEPPVRLTLIDYRYTSKFGDLPFQANFVTEFLITPGDNGTTLRVTQEGFPADSMADEYYAACQQGWTDTFAGIRRYLEG